MPVNLAVAGVGGYCEWFGNAGFHHRTDSTHSQTNKTTKNNNNNENNNSQQLQSDQQTSTSWFRTRSGGGTMVDLSGKEYCHHFRCSSNNNKHENNDQHQNRTRMQQSWADQTNASMFHHILQSCEAARTQGMNGTLCAVGLVIW